MFGIDGPASDPASGNYGASQNISSPDKIQTGYYHLSHYSQVEDVDKVFNLLYKVSLIDILFFLTYEEAVFTKLLYPVYRVELPWEGSVTNGTISIVPSEVY